MRMIWRNLLCWTGVILASAAGAARGQNDSSAVKVTLHASVGSVAPGDPFDAGVRFELPTDALLYWENPGGTGAPPTVKWTLPAGFEAGLVRYPAPKRQEIGGAVANVLEATPTLLTTITPPADLAVGAPVELRADVTWAVAEKPKLGGSQSLTLSLPTAQEAAAASDDESLIFRIAQRMHPVPTEKAKDITLSVEPSKKSVAQGDVFELVFDVRVNKGFHTQSNKPLGEFFVPTSIFWRLTRGIEFGEPAWPPAHIREDRNFGRISEFEGDFKVRVPVNVNGPTASKDVALSGLLTYQACNDRGQCHPPESVEWSAIVVSQSVQAGGASPANLPAATAKPSPTPAPAAPEADKGADTSGAAAVNKTPTAPVQHTPSEVGGLASLGLLGALIGGFIGGLILNIMPCVLPVISIKVLSFVQQAGDDPKRVFRLGLTFAAGIVISFWVLAGGILAIQAATETTRGWGAFFQSPVFVVGMIIVMFTFALNLFGVFDVNLPGATTGKLAEATEREGFGGAFMKGVLATLLATPCTAPFLAPAISFALAGSALTIAVVFTSAGVGMAFPYVLLTARPAWMKHLPKPGGWMEGFKQFMGFLLVGTAVWLLWVLSAVRGAEAVVWTVAFLAFLGLACWLYGRVDFNWRPGRRTLSYATAIASIGLGGWFSYGMYTSVPPVDWVHYEPGLAQKLAKEGRTVYVDYTAAWCLTCQVNKKVVFGSHDVLRKFETYDVVPVKADYSGYDPLIADDLKAFQRDAVPLNVIYPAGKPDEPIVLPVVLTPGRVLDALTEAGPSIIPEKEHDPTEHADAQ